MMAPTHAITANRQMGAHRVAGAPISWGVSEMAGWGYRMPAERVFTEMKQAGLDATELGPPGYLPADAAARCRLMRRHGLRVVAGFLAAVLHDPAFKAREAIERLAATLASSGAKVLVIAAALPGESYDAGRALTSEEWGRLVRGLRVADGIAARHGLRLAFHPHVGTAVATVEDVRRLLDTAEVALCLDTGHLFLGGVDPAEMVDEASSRVAHVHLKDVDATIAERLQAGRMSYVDAVRDGLYTVLGAGDLDIEAVVSRLHQAGYSGWFVLEQDTALAGEPESSAGLAAAVRQSLDYFRRVTGSVAGGTNPETEER